MVGHGVEQHAVHIEENSFQTEFTEMIFAQVIVNGFFNHHFFCFCKDTKNLFSDSCMSDAYNINYDKTERNCLYCFVFVKKTVNLQAEKK